MTTMARPGDSRKPFLAGSRQGVVEPGTAHPLGATVTPTGVNFGVYAKQATGMDIQFFYAAEGGGLSHPAELTLGVSFMTAAPE